MALEAQCYPHAETPPLKPFLRWVGGKCKIVSQLVDYLPRDIMKRRYWEPFLGAGSLFFALQPSRAFLSDANPHLIDCYQWVASAPDEVYRLLLDHIKQHSSEHYYRVRDQYNQHAASAEQAARFIYLNSTCFNGVFRVNTKGEFNVPVGRKATPSVPSLDAMRQLGDVLRKVRLSVGSYEIALQNVRRGDFVYLDPPYPPLNGTAFFTHYTRDRFGMEDQKALAHQVEQLSRRGVLWMMTNADTTEIRSFYAGYQMQRLSVTRYVSCKKQRHQVFELVISNYQP